MQQNKPTCDDILTAIRKAETRDWVDPSEVPGTWECKLFDATGQRCGDGNAFTPGEAMGLAWLCAWAPDALIDAYVEPDSVPLDIPDGYRFELTPPGEA